MLYRDVIIIYTRVTLIHISTTPTLIIRHLVSWRRKIYEEILGVYRCIVEQTAQDTI
jgi:hypothetical protein